jgi:hypothetical protein
MRIDELTIHADDIEAGSGAEFHGVPIREVNIENVDVREGRDMHSRVIDYLGEAATVEILPGEAIVGNLIRRTTTAEVVGDTYYDKEIPEGRQVGIYEAQEQNRDNGKLITWRPNNLDIAILHEEVPSELSV